ncbi:MAG: tail fiber domain-containing protein [Muribaculaceae bacterium]|nr:tail fiber domain-containing protein [Muribaculaceae bacterium]
MKKIFNLKSILSITVIFCSFLTSLAQITYDGRIINIGGATENGKFNFLIDKFSGLYWTFNNGNKFFQCDVTPANPRLAGTGDKIVFYNSFTSTYNNIQVANVYNYSDERAKTNITTINSGLNTILNLRPVSYNWKNNNEIVSRVATLSSDSVAQPLGPNDGKLQYGFLAQEVEQVLPDAVATDDDGNKLINYTAIIPLLVQSIQELQSLVAEQALTIERLSNQANSSSINVTTDKIVSCTPNPTSGQIAFEYTISDNASNANIYICNLIGDVKRTISCPLNATSVSENLSDLRDGIYIATLSVDGISKDSKRIILKK